jgi:hypothetical protein
MSNCIVANKSLHQQIVPHGCSHLSHFLCLSAISAIIRVSDPRVYRESGMVYGYVRVSTDRQVEEGESLGAQQRTLQGYAMMQA